jgi:SnoaL-like protein
MVRLKPLIPVFAAMGLVMQLTVRTQENPPTASAAPMELTALDYIQIQQLVAKYAEYIDTCSNNGYDYADLFTSDGFFAPFQNGQIGRKSQGREALARVSGGGPNGCTGAGWIKQGVKHIYVNHIINPTPEGASGQVNMLMIGLGGDKNRIEHDGAYYDTYEKTAQGWRFKSRIHHANYIPGDGRGGAATTTDGQPAAPGSQPAAPGARQGVPGAPPAQSGR